MQHHVYMQHLLVVINHKIVGHEEIHIATHVYEKHCNHIFMHQETHATSGVLI